MPLPLSVLQFTSVSHSPTHEWTDRQGAARGLAMFCTDR